MLIPRKTVIAGIVFGLFVSGASLAQAAVLNKDTVVTPAGGAGQLVDPPPYQNQDVTGNGYNLTFTTFEGGPYWDRIFAASSQDMKVSGIGALQIIDSNADESDGLIYAKDKNTLTIDAASLNIASKKNLAIHGFGGSVNVVARGNVDISVDGQNAIMAQPVGANDGIVSIHAAGDINIHSTNAVAVLSGILNDQAKSQTASVSLQGKNITITAKGQSSAAVRVYDRDKNWNAETPGTGTSELSLNADENLTIESSGFGLHVQRLGQYPTPATPVEAIAGQSINISGGSSALYVQGNAGSNGNVSLNIRSPEVNLSSTNSSAVHIMRNASVNLGSSKQASNIHISSAKNKDAIYIEEDTGTFASTNSNITIASGNVKSFGTIALTDTRMELGENSTFSTETLKANDSEIVINSADTTVTAKTNNSTNLHVLASGTYADQFASAAQAREALAKQTHLGGNYLLGGEAGTVADSWQEVFDVNGNKVVKTTENASLEALRQFNAMTLAQWRNETNHVSKRLGDVRNNRGEIGAWARVYGYDSTVKDNINVDVKATSIQVGGDVSVGQNWVVGGAFTYTNMDGEMDNGSGEADSYSLAAYASGFFDCGGFIDVIGRIGRISTDITASTLSAAGGILDGSYDNTAFGLSVETGYHWTPVSILYIEPQVELSYSYVLGDDFKSGSNGVSVDQDDFQSLVGRLGAQIGASLPENAGRIYLEASVNHDFLGDADATATPAAGGPSRNIEADLGGTWYSYGIGLQLQLGDSTSLYGSLDRANGNDYQEDYRYSIGLRHIW